MRKRRGLKATAANHKQAGGGHPREGGALRRDGDVPVDASGRCHSVTLKQQEIYKINIKLHVPRRERC